MKTEVAFGCKWTESADGSYPAVLGSMVNPITRREVRIEPPVTVESEQELDAIGFLFDRYCSAAWDYSRIGSPLFRLDPEAISADWLKWKPPATPAEPE